MTPPSVRPVPHDFYLFSARICTKMIANPSQKCLSPTTPTFFGRVTGRTHPTPHSIVRPLQQRTEQGIRNPVPSAASPRRREHARVIERYQDKTSMSKIYKNTTKKITERVKTANHFTGWGMGRQVHPNDHYIFRPGFASTGICPPAPVLFRATSTTQLCGCPSPRC